MADPVDLAAARDAWERIEAGCAGLLARRCTRSHGYLGCLTDCSDIERAFNPELEQARPLIAAALAELEQLRAAAPTKDERAALHWLMLHPIQVRDEAERVAVNKALHALVRLAGNP